MLMMVVIVRRVFICGGGGGERVWNVGATMLEVVLVEGDVGVGNGRVKG